MAQLTRRHALWPALAAGAAALTLFLGERPFRENEEVRWVFAGLAIVLVLAALAQRAREWLAATAETKPIANLNLSATGGVLLALGLYGVEQQLTPGGAAQVATMVGWMLLLGLSLVPLLSIELAVHPVGRAPIYELGGLTRAHARGLGMALLTAVLALANYVVSNNDVRTDLARGSRATASEATLRAVRELTKPVEVTLFWPRTNEVGDLVSNYFEPLSALNAKLSVRRIDHALAGESARKANITENGWLELRHENAREKVRVGTKIRAARGALRRLDRKVLESIIKVTVRERVAYVTAGHGERGLRARDKDDSRPALTLLRRQLEAWQFEVKTFGVGDGATTAIPDDASLVIVAGPEKPFLPAELEVLHRARRLLILLEAERGGAEGTDALLSPFGLRLDEGLLANARSNAPLTRTKADRSFVWTNRYSAHPAVTTMSRNERLATVLGRSGSLVKTSTGGPPNQKVDIVMTAVDDTFIDSDGDLERDAQERSTNFPLAAAVTRTATSGPQDEGRVFVLADTDVFGDELIKLVQGNFYLLRDVVAWLQVDEDPIVPTVSEKDVRIVHQAEEDAILFYGTTFGAPLFVLALGALATRRRRSR